MPKLQVLLTFTLPPAAVLLSPPVALVGTGTVTLTSSVRSRMTSALSKLTMPLESALRASKKGASINLILFYDLRLVKADSIFDSAHPLQSHGPLDHIYLVRATLLRVSHRAPS